MTAEKQNEPIHLLIDAIIANAKDPEHTHRLCSSLITEITIQLTKPLTQISQVINCRSGTPEEEYHERIHNLPRTPW